MPPLYFDPHHADHRTGPHPENAARLDAVAAMLGRSPVAARFERVVPPAASADALRAVHRVNYVRSLGAFAAAGGGRIEADTVVAPGSLPVARRAVGAACAAVDAVLGTDETRAFCAVRPPGHHARPASAMGFCLYGNVAVAAEHPRRAHGLERVLIVDWDVHHGNGTQEVFYADGGVHFLSLHRSPFYPGTGDAEETGTGDGLGATWNLPTTHGTPRRLILDRFASLLDNAAASCRPELVLLSAGFDAHADDPIGDLGLHTEDFTELTTRVVEVAEAYCGGKLVSVLEGGYDPERLAECVEVHLEALTP